MTTKRLYMAKLPPAEKVQARVITDPTDPESCWLYQGHLMSNGYGTVRSWDYSKNRSVEVLAHRVMYEAYVELLDPTLTVDHLCGVRRCVNPSHLDQCSRQENTARQWMLRPPRRVRDQRAECSNGHSFDEANTYRNPSSGYRACRTCSRRSSLQSWRNKKVNANG